ncbi:MAG TPA: sugar-binding transcriptional regulator [Thermomicrobiales bacterium]|nr:sugar-binding transcriptional regulator [Thermomicrobiales bacterium]
MAEPHGALLISVARMYYLDGMGQSEIADIFGVSRSTVSRLLTTARERGIVRISVDEYDPRDHELEQRLTGRFGLRDAIVVRSIEGQAPHVRRAVGYFAAPIVAQRIAAAGSVGVAGGRTLGQLIHFIEPQSHQDHLNVVQLMGTVGSAPSSVDASELSRTLARRFQGSFHTINAPAFMDDPRSRDLLLSHGQMRSVWGMFPTLDLALIGIGSLEDSVFAERNVLAANDLEILRAQGAVGEICGRFFDAAGQECHSQLRERVIGVELETLRSGKEVVAITAGSSRRVAIHAALAGGLVHSLVIDDRGAEAVLAMAGAEVRRHVTEERAS